jgi:hypothetical protein
MCDECIPLRINPDGSATEIAPTYCANGHPLIADRTLVSGKRCWCRPGHDLQHRTYTCLECGVTMYYPPCLTLPT